MHRFHPIILAAILPMALSGCVGAVVVGGLAAAGGAGYTAAQERGIGGAVDDFTIKNNIETALGQAQPPLQLSVVTSVYQGRVLLTGNVATPQMREEAGRRANTVPGVRALYDEVQVGPPETGWASATDAWITTRLRSELVLEPGIRSDNYTIDTADQSVYLIGSARTQQELDRATQIARYIPNVRRVVSYVDIRPGAPIASAPQPPGPPPGAQMPDDSPHAAPTTPVQVDKL